MIIYHRTKAEFRKDVFEDRIAVIVEEELYKKTSKRTSDNEFRAFRNSLGFMERVLNASQSNIIFLIQPKESTSL